MLYGLDKLLEDRLKIKINVVDDPLSCVAMDRQSP